MAYGKVGEDTRPRERATQAGRIWPLWWRLLLYLTTVSEDIRHVQRAEWVLPIPQVASGEGRIIRPCHLQLRHSIGSSVNRGFPSSSRVPGRLPKLSLHQATWFGEL